MDFIGSVLPKTGLAYSRHAINAEFNFLHALHIIIIKYKFYLCSILSSFILLLGSFRNDLLIEFDIAVHYHGSNHNLPNTRPSSHDT
jgi:hypothetical protein